MHTATLPAGLPELSDQMVSGSPVSSRFLLEPYSARLMLCVEAYCLSPLAGTIGFIFSGRELNPWPLSALEWKILVQFS